MSSMGAAPPARQPWRGSAAPCHGRLGAWDIHPLALGQQSAGAGWMEGPANGIETVARGRGLPARWLPLPGALLSPLRRTGGQDVKGWPANPELVWHL